VVKSLYRFVIPTQIDWGCGGMAIKIENLGGGRIKIDIVIDDEKSEQPKPKSLSEVMGWTKPQKSDEEYYKELRSQRGPLSGRLDEEDSDFMRKELKRKWSGRDRKC
jgi:hypothetical protein